MYSFQTKTDISSLNRFIGHKTELSIVDPNLCFMFQEFGWQYDGEFENLILFDQTEDEAKFLIPLSSVQEVTNLTEDIYHDVIDIRTEKFILSICTMEERPIFPICSKCGKDLSLEYVHEIDLLVGYGSRYDGDRIHKKYCDDCMAATFGLEVDVNE